MAVFHTFIYNNLRFQSMVATKLTREDVSKIQKLLKKGHDPLELARKYGVSRSTIYKRAKYPYASKYTPIETKNKIIKKIKEGYSKAEAAQMYYVPINTVIGFTKGIPGHKAEGNHIVRKHGIQLLNRLMGDGYLISDFVVSTVRNLQRHFPMIMSARYKEKTFFYMKGREEETIEAFFRDKPDRIISYTALLEISSLLGVELSKNSKRDIVKRLKGQHEMCWKSRRRVQRKLEDFEPGSPFLLRKPAKSYLRKRISKKNSNLKQNEPSYWLFPKKLKFDS